MGRVPKFLWFIVCLTGPCALILAPILGIIDSAGERSDLKKSHAKSDYCEICFKKVSKDLLRAKYVQNTVYSHGWAGTVPHTYTTLKWVCNDCYYGKNEKAWRAKSVVRNNTTYDVARTNTVPQTPKKVYEESPYYSDDDYFRPKKGKIVYHIKYGEGVIESVGDVIVIKFEEKTAKFYSLDEKYFSKKPYDKTT